MDSRLLTNSFELRVGIDDTRLVEKGDERLIGRFYQQKLERVSVEGDALEGAQDGVQNGATSD
jgi:hypothetical protein